MDFKFLRRNSIAVPTKVEVEPRRIEFPKDQTRKLLELWDAYDSKDAGNDRVAKYDFWKFVEQELPETGHGQWVIENATTKVYLVEKFGKGK